MTKQHPKFHHSDEVNRPGEQNSAHPFTQPGGHHAEQVMQQRSAEFQQAQANESHGAEGALANVYHKHSH